MNGKKVVICFLIAVIITGATLALWIKQGYESRPKNVNIEEEKK
jgi:hypothetical protein